MFVCVGVCSKAAHRKTVLGMFGFGFSAVHVLAGHEPAQKAGHDILEAVYKQKQGLSQQAS
jgi:hypothetical protein